LRQLLDTTPAREQFRAASNLPAELTNLYIERGRLDDALVLADTKIRQRSGSITTVSSGSSTRPRDQEPAPGCFPRLAPDHVRDDRFLGRLLLP
jgi:hypothetical protein